MTAASHRARARLTPHPAARQLWRSRLPAKRRRDGSLAFGFNLNFSLDPRHGLSLSRRPLAAGGRGPRDRLSRSQRQWRARSRRAAREGRAGHDRHAARRSGRPMPRARSPSAASPPTCRSRSASTRPASPTRCWCRRRRSRSSCRGRASRRMSQIGLVGGGDIEGAVVKSGGLGFEGLDLELVDAAGKVVGTARTDFDGFFLFERVAYGALHGARRARIGCAPRRFSPTSACAFEVSAGKAGRPARRDPGVGRCRSSRRPHSAATPNIDFASLRTCGASRWRPCCRCWCGREDSNFHGLSATATSTLRVYQFRHDRTS